MYKEQTGLGSIHMRRARIDSLLLLHVGGFTLPSVKQISFEVFSKVRYTVVPGAGIDVGLLYSNKQRCKCKLLNCPVYTVPAR